MSVTNETQSLNNTSSVSTIIVVLNLVQQRFVNQLPLIITILGLIGFIGNTFTFLQPVLRKNTFCIYTLCGSFVDIINLMVNLLPNYLISTGGNVVSLTSVSLLCKLKLFALVFLPQVSMDLLILSLIDRYACTYGPTSRMRRLLQLRMVPWCIGITVVISCAISLYSPILNDVVIGVGCVSINPVINSVLYILIQGIMTPVIMLVIVLFTYRRFRQSRQRVVSTPFYCLQAFIVPFQGAVGVANRNHVRNQFIGTVFAQVFVTSFFTLQWIIIYWYFLATQYDNKSAEAWAITFFVFGLSNDLYYFINVRSFYLSTLTSRLFRDTFMIAFLKMLPGQLHRRWNARNQNVTITLGTLRKREEGPPRQI